jgi:hypothetical protein
MRSQRRSVIAICLIFDPGRSRGATAGGGSWDVNEDGEDTCVLLTLFDAFFDAGGEGPRFFFGFRPRLLGMGKWEVWHRRHVGMVHEASKR